MGAGRAYDELIHRVKNCKNWALDSRYYPAVTPSDFPLSSDIKRVRSCHMFYIFKVFQLFTYSLNMQAYLVESAVLPIRTLIFQDNLSLVHLRVYSLLISLYAFFFRNHSTRNQQIRKSHCFLLSNA